jgi:16S rRNA (adenine1518-N6/adenine1519-N6)-dimethyltransferase
MTSARQTQSYLIRRFEEAGIRPETRHGQNFLIDLNLLDILIEAAHLEPRDVVLEIGTGLGSLTARMALTAAHIVTVEIDRRMYQLAGEELAELPNVTMLLQDALKNKNHLDPNVMEAVRDALGKGDSANGTPRRFKLVANLPYNIATPIISNLLTADPVPVSMTVTIQKELADRIVARPGTKDYSALSIWMQALCDIEIVRIMPPAAFWPRPKVHSAILQIVPNAEKRSKIADPAFFHQIVRSLFLHRRKFLRGVLIATLADQLDKPAVDELLADLRHPPDARAEQLGIEQFIALADAIRMRTQPSIAG